MSTASPRCNRRATPTTPTIRTAPDCHNRAGGSRWTTDEYDTGNRIWDGADLGSFYYEYDANSNRVKLSFSGDAVPPGCEVEYITYQYTPESVDRLETENYWDAQDDLVFCIDYRYDLCGNRVLRMRQPAEGGRESATTYYEYDELNQLTRAVDVERDEEFQTYLIGATYFEVDQSGNTVTRLTTDDQGLLTGATYYDWDAESQLTGVRSLAGLDNAFAYDGRYQRVEKQQAAGTVRYNWDGLNVLLERDGEDEPLATHTHGPVPIAGIGTHLTTRQHGETPEDLWVHHDAIGSTRQLSDETQPPALTRQNLLDAWGNLLATAGTQDTPYRFTGKETDEDTGLIYFGRRFYDPTIGRWLNRDPARDGQNWYEYAGSNPMARVDAEGLQADAIGSAYFHGARRAAVRRLYGDRVARAIYSDPFAPRWTLLFVAEHRDVIREAARDAGVPPALIAGYILAELELPANPHSKRDVASYYAHRMGIAEWWAKKKALDPEMVRGLEHKYGPLAGPGNSTFRNQVFDTNVSTLGPLQIDVNTAIEFGIIYPANQATVGPTTDPALVVRALLDPDESIRAGGRLLGRFKTKLRESLAHAEGWSAKERTSLCASLGSSWYDWDLTEIDAKERDRLQMIVGALQDQGTWWHDLKDDGWSWSHSHPTFRFGNRWWVSTVLDKAEEAAILGVVEP